jgi:glycosyltransferase involved in cell wall biosynthesis
MGAETSAGLRILEVVHAFPPRSLSGTELYTYHLAQALGRLGHTVSVLHVELDSAAPHLSLSRDRFDGLEVLRIHKQRLSAFPPPYLDAAMDPLFERVLDEERFDLVHIQHLVELSSSWIAIAKARGLPVALKLDDFFFCCPTIHLVTTANAHCAEGPDSLDRCVACLWRGAPSQEPDEIASRFALIAHRRATLQQAIALPDFVHTPSRFAHRIHRRHGYANARFEVIPTGIAPFAPRPRTAAPAGRVRIGYLGSLHQRKGIFQLIDAIAGYRAARQSEPDAAELEFSVWGNTAGDAVRDAVFAKLGQLGGIAYRGGFGPDDRARIFAELDCLVAPSIGENYPFVLREALHAGVPVVASAIAGVPEIVTPGVNGWLVPPGDAAALARVFLEIARDPAGLERLTPAPGGARTIDAEAQELDVVFRALARPSAATLVADGSSLIARGECGAAHERFAEARSRFGEDARVLLGLGRCEFERGRIEEAGELFRRACSLDPLDADAVVNWALVAERLGRMDEVAPAMARACAAHPDDSDLHGLLVRARPEPPRAEAP